MCPSTEGHQRERDQHPGLSGWRAQHSKAPEKEPDGARIQDEKDRDQQVRVTCGDRWLVWYEDQWQVMECKYRQRNSKQIVATDDLNEALQALLAH